MTPEQMAALHARAFGGQGRAWSAQEFATLMSSGHVFAVGDDTSFALGRAIADEAELLTIATDPDHWRTGLGRACLRRFEREARARDAATIFLDVAEDNLSATMLYRSEGYVELARRASYYARKGALRVDALILRKTLD